MTRMKILYLLAFEVKSYRTFVATKKVTSLEAIITECVIR